MRLRNMLVLLFAGYFFIGIFFIVYGGLNGDEGWYLYAGKLVYEQKIPYLDFMYNQTPLLPYIYGLLQHFIGPSLLLGRLTSFFLALMNAFLTVKIIERLTGSNARSTALLFMVLTPYNIYYAVIVKTYSLASFFLLAALYFKTNKVAYPYRDFIPFFLLSLAVLVRLSLLPVLGIFLIALFFENTTKKSILVAIITGSATILIGLAPFWFFAKDQLLFNLITQHYPSGYAMVLSLNNILKNMAVFVVMYPALLLLLGCNVFVFKEILSAKRPFKTVTKNLGILTVLFSIFTVSFVHFFFLAPLIEYQSVIMNLLVIAAVYPLFRFKEEILRVVTQDTLKTLLSLLFLISLLTQLYALRMTIAVGASERPLDEIAAVSSFISANTPQDSKILTFETAVTLQSDRHVVDGFELSIYNYFPSFNLTEAKKYHVFNDATFLSYISNKTASALILSDHAMNQIQDKEKIVVEINKNYALVATLHNFGHARQTIRIYLPKQ